MAPKRRNPERRAQRQGSAAKGKRAGGAGSPRRDHDLRIVGGRFGGRKLAYSGDVRTRPMKERVREAIFNLIGPVIKEKHAIDPFAGTGALALEALSRGAARATMVEQHFPTAAVIRRNIATLEVEDITQVFTADAFIWAGQMPDLGELPWVVFCSPPFEFYRGRCDDMIRLIETFLEKAPPGSIFVVEADEEFDTALLPQAEQWDIRRYRPAVVALLRS